MLYINHEFQLITMVPMVIVFQKKATLQIYGSRSVHMQIGECQRSTKHTPYAVPLRVPYNASLRLHTQRTQPHF